MNDRLDIEQKLLALLIAESPDASPFLTEILSSTDDFDWERFAALVERHRVGALVYAGLQQFSAINPPGDLVRHFSGKTSENAEYYMRAVKLASELMEAFSKQGIACASLKGVGIAAEYYAAPSQRQMIDVDLLVAPDRYAEAEQIVAAHGFELFYPDFDLTEQSRETFMALHNAFTFIRKSDGMQLDLHWRMVPNPSLMPWIDQLWSQSVVGTTIGGQTIPMLPAAMHCVYICVHGAKSGWVRLKWLADVDHVVRGLSDQEAGEAAEIFASDDLQRIGAVSLALAERVLGTPIPAAFADLMQHDVSDLIDLELGMMFEDMPSRPHSLKDWAHYRDRFRHSVLLKSGGGYRRHALLRELARPRDLATISVKPGRFWVLGVLSPILGMGRALKRLVAAKP
ncbi:nucleotidyltransferase family protein [Pontixanthobacter sp. CEM42]|uniref:nucleotidyltransferase domain-containing protein n=1 Tax=Pontixanthobacter sp. CEM42 TaxID=2792077 RepID=UPI001ADFFB78|nr:nucleotidyltransferase family protein [Pontixanthobacter sp. CEM42]